MPANRVIALESPPGGSGKTSLAVLLSMTFAKRGETVALIDGDNNNNATDWTLPETPETELESANLFHALSGEMILPDCIHRSPFGFDVVPATPDLYQLQSFFRQTASSRKGTIRELEEIEEESVSRFLSEIALLPHDRVIIDGPPGLNFESGLALQAADLCLMPLKQSRKQMTAFEILHGFASEVRQEPLTILGVPNLINTDQEDKILRKSARDLGIRLTKTTIRKNSALEIAMDLVRPIGSRAVSLWKRADALAQEVSKAK